MTAREFAEACITFQQFGKIKDIDFDHELSNEILDPKNSIYIRGIDFETGEVTLGELVESYCDCCGSYWDWESTFDLDELARKGYLGDVVFMLNGVLDKKGIGC